MVGVDLLDDLYGGAPDDFVARRDAAAKAARAAGDRDLARSIAALRKPTAAAALVNALVRDDPGLADRVVTLGDALREAERTFDGRALRDLSRERRTLVTGLVARARTLGSAAGQRVGDAVAQEVDQTLTAALADPDVAREVTSGHLAAGREYSGFGGLGGFGLGAADADDATDGTGDAAAPRGAPAGSGGSPLRRVPRGRLTVVEDLDEDAGTSTGRATSSGVKAGGKGRSAGKARPGSGKTKTGAEASSGPGKTQAGAEKSGAAKAGAEESSAAGTSKAGADESRATGTSKTGAKESKSPAGRAKPVSSATATERRRRAAETARDAAAAVRDRARKVADRATARRDERRADLDDAAQAARAAHDLHDELRTAMTDLRRRIAKADKDALRAEDRLAKAERALHDEERSAIAAAQDLRRAERALQAADRDLDALDDEPPV